MPRLAGLLALLLVFPARAEFKYHAPDQIGGELRILAGKNRDSAGLQVLAKTPGGRDVLLLSLGTKESKLPAVLVVANMEGNSPLATEAALELSRLLLSGWKDDLKSRTGTRTSSKNRSWKDIQMTAPSTTTTTTRPTRTGPRT
jgi:hypothetical protein